MDRVLIPRYLLTLTHCIRTLLLHVIAEVENENVKAKVLNFINKKFKIENFKCEVSMLDFCHRLGVRKTTSKKSRPIIVRLLSYTNRCKMWLRWDN